MIRRWSAGCAALRGGVRKVHILRTGRVPHSVLLEIFTTAGIGTEIVRAGREAGAEMTGAEAIALTQRYQMGNYSRFPVTFVRGEGSWLYDDLGKPYLDFPRRDRRCDSWHAHPAVTRAISEAGGWRLACTSPNLFHVPSQARLGSACPMRRPGEGSLLGNSDGGERGGDQAGPPVGLRSPREGRHGIVVLEGSFHGRTYGGLSATAQPSSTRVRADAPGVRDRPPRDIDALDGGA